jgi:hypothetical protein
VLPIIGDLTSVALRLVGATVVIDDRAGEERQALGRTHAWAGLGWSGKREKEIGELGGRWAGVGPRRERWWAEKKSVFLFLKMLNSAKTCLFRNKITRAPKIM